MSTGSIGGGTTARAPLILAAAVIALVAAVLACYLPTPGDYWISYDNPQMIGQEPRIRALTLEGSARTAALKTLIATPHHDLYQPLASLSWAIDYALFAEDRSGFHAHSLALHIAVVVALFFLALRLCHSVPAAFLATLLCALHPVMVQSVCWTISRTSSLAASWILIGSHLHLCYARRPGSHYLLALSTLAFAISMLAKPVPSVVFVPVLLGLWVGRELRPRILLEALPLALVATLFTVVSLQLSSSIATDSSIVRPWGEVLLAAPAGVVLTLANTLWPRDLALHYGYELAASLIGWRALGVAGSCVVAGIVGSLLWRRGERGVLLSGAAFLALLGPQIAAIRYRDILTADRYAYIPLLFLALGVASLLAHVLRTREPRSLARRAAIALPLLAAVALGSQTRAESRLWADELQLWLRVVSQTPAPLPYLALCKLHAREGRPAEMVEACTRAYELAAKDRFAAKDPAYAYNLATHARRAGEQSQASTQADASRTASRYFELARTSAEEGIKRWPERVDLRYELGRTQLAVGDSRLAIATFEELLAIEPDDEQSITFLGVALFEVGELDRAVAVLDANPAAGMVEPIRFITLARIHTLQGRHDYALGANLAWVQADPGERAAHEAFLASVRAAADAKQLANVQTLLRLYQGLYMQQPPEQAGDQPSE